MTAAGHATNQPAKSGSVTELSLTELGETRP